jgi:hypothetical protein
VPTTSEIIPVMGAYRYVIRTVTSLFPGSRVGLIQMKPVFGIVGVDGVVQGVLPARQGSSVSTIPPPPILARVALMMAASG